MFGVRAPDGEPGAWERAGERLAKFGQRTEKVTITEVPPPGGR